MKNYYHILGLSFESKPENSLIYAAYKALVKLYHPDIFKGNNKDSDPPQVIQQPIIAQPQIPVQQPPVEPKPVYTDTSDNVTEPAKTPVSTPISRNTASEASRRI